MNNILNIVLPLDHGGEGVYWLTNKYFCWLDCLRPVQGHKYRHSTRSNFAGFWTFFNIICPPCICYVILKKNTDIPVFCTVYGLNFFSAFCFKMYALQFILFKKALLKEDLILERLANIKIEINCIYTYTSIWFVLIFFLKRPLSEYTVLKLLSPYGF